MKNIYFLIFIMILISSSASFSRSEADFNQQSLDSLFSKPNQILNVFYRELATLFFYGSFSMNHDHSMNENFWFRIGYVIGWVGSQIHGTFTLLPKTVWWLLPAISIGYCYQPSECGLLFRTGLMFDYYEGDPIQFSFGYAY
jgi:hypothetical protein